MENKLAKPYFAKLDRSTSTAHLDKIFPSLLFLTVKCGLLTVLIRVLMLSVCPELSTYQSITECLEANFEFLLFIWRK